MPDQVGECDSRSWCVVELCREQTPSTIPWASGCSVRDEHEPSGSHRCHRCSPAVTATRLHGYTATRLPDGRVLIAGGYGDGTTTLATVELFDPATKRCVPTGSLMAARSDHIAVLLKNGKVLVAGGLGRGWSFLSSAELYDPASGSFSTTGNLRSGDRRIRSRECHAASPPQARWRPASGRPSPDHGRFR